MYNMSSSLPAPYELNSQAPQMDNSMGAPMSTPDASHFARGGRTKRKANILVHANRHELDVLDHLQGSREHGPGGERSYSHLEDLFKNPHIVSNIHKHIRHHHAHGGVASTIPELHHLEQEGRHGDNTLAWIGPHTKHLFDHLAGGSSVNPHTGHPEYFSLKNLLGGAWNAIKGVGARLAPMAGSAIGTVLGGPMGTALGNMGGRAISSLLGGGENANQIGQGITQGLHGAFQGIGGGLSPRQAMGYGLQKFGGSMGNSGIGRGLQGFGSAYGNGGNLTNALQRGASEGFNAMGGKQGLMNSAQNIARGFGTPGGLRGSMSNEVNQYRNKFLPSFNQQQPEMSQEMEQYQ